MKKDFQLLIKRATLYHSHFVGDRGFGLGTMWCHVARLMTFLVLLCAPAVLLGRHGGIHSAVPPSSTCSKDDEKITIPIGSVCGIYNMGFTTLYSRRAARTQKDLGASSEWKTLLSEHGIDWRKIWDELDIPDETKITPKHLERILPKMSEYGSEDTSYDINRLNTRWEEIKKDFKSRFDSIETSEHIAGKTFKEDRTSDPTGTIRQITGYKHPLEGAHKGGRAVFDFANKHYDFSGSKSKTPVTIHAKTVKGLTFSGSETHLKGPVFAIGNVENLNFEGGTLETYVDKHRNRYKPTFTVFKEFSNYQRGDRVTNTSIRGTANFKKVTANELQMSSHFPYNSNKVDFQSAKLRDSVLRFRRDWWEYPKNAKGAGNGKFVFEKADLTSADLEGSSFYDGANFKSATLKNANLSSTELPASQFQGANLQMADLTNADFRDANLNKADLKGANLMGTNIKGASFRGADLRGVLNLEEAKGLGSADFKGAIVNPDQYLILQKHGHEGCCQVRGNCTYRGRPTLITTTAKNSTCGSYCLARVGCEAKDIPFVIFTAFCKAEHGKCPSPTKCSEKTVDYDIFIAREDQLWEGTTTEPTTTTGSDTTTPSGTGGAVR